MYFKSSSSKEHLEVIKMLKQNKKISTDRNENKQTRNYYRKKTKKKS